VNAELPESLLAALSALVDSLREADVGVIIIGGVASSVLGRPRLTRDIDALADVPEDEWSRVVDAVAAFGIMPRIGAVLEFAVRSRVLLLRHEASQIDIDLIVATLPFERDAVAAGQSRSLGSIEIRLPRIEDLLIMKAIAHRPRDLLDIEGLLQAHPEIDLERARRWIGEFAHAAVQPELLADFERLVRAAR
jgi:hypothetical protein